MDAPLDDFDRRVLREREFWVEVAPGKRFKFLRPLLMVEAPTAVSGIKECCGFVLGWEGIRESDFFASGGDIEVPYTKQRATDLLCDNLEWAQTIATAMAKAVNERMQATRAAEKN